MAYASFVGAAQKVSCPDLETRLSQGSPFHVTPVFGLKIAALMDKGANGQSDSRVDRPERKPDLRTVDWYKDGNGADQKKSSNGNGAQKNDDDDDDDEKDDDDDKESEGFDRQWDVATLG